MFVVYKVNIINSEVKYNDIDKVNLNFFLFFVFNPIPRYRDGADCVVASCVYYKPIGSTMKDQLKMN